MADFGSKLLLATDIEEDAISYYSLVDNLTNWAANQKGMVLNNFANVDLNEIVSDCIELFSRRASSKNITLTSEINPGVTVFADKNAVSTVIRNLIDNAIKYTNVDGQIQVTKELSEGRVKILVTDNGEGMSLDVINHILSEDMVESTHGTAFEKGSGIGLGIVKNLVKKMKGEFELSSKVGMGTTCSVLLPA